MQTGSTYKEYFQRQAEAWEGISYMKARAIAGDTERATDFLNELQELDWRRYGQGGRSRLGLATMRAKLEKEFGNRNRLKAGSGGYYDIDFAPMYAHLDREDADFLRDAATVARTDSAILSELVSVGLLLHRR